ncbi:hypothetical protein ACHWQZ_G003691 [Mnemiopsis leidyi]
MLQMIRDWKDSFKYYARVNRMKEGDEDWRSYIDNHNAVLGGSLRCFSNGIFKYRIVLVSCLLLNVIPLYMLASTYVLFTPELSWKCIVEQHTGVTPICDSYSKKTNQKHAVCAMELGIDYSWNFTFTRSPILEFSSYCPLQRSVEPKLVNILGSFCGSLVGGIFIDSLGRRNMSLICAFFSMLCTLTYRVSSNMIMFTYQEFIKGVFSSVAAMSVLTWCVELSKPKYCSLIVACFFICSSLGGIITTGITYLSFDWRIVVIIISSIGFGLLPLIFLVPSSLRFMVARGKTKDLPKNIDFREGVIVGSRAKDCLSRPQTNRLYGINAVFLIMLGFSTHVLIEVLFIQHKDYDIFEKAVMMHIVLLAGHFMALFVACCPMLMYVINVFMVFIAGILAIVATSTNYSDNFWSLARVFTGTCLMLVSLSHALTFTTLKQVPTLNRGFYVSGLNASYMLGSLVSVIIQSWCLERKGDPNPFCVTNSEDLKLLTAGIILLVSVTAAFLNTCLTRNVNLPHSYRELKKWSEAMSDNRNSNDDMELVRVNKEKPGGETA